MILAKLDRYSVYLPNFMLNCYILFIFYNNLQIYKEIGLFLLFLKSKNYFFNFIIIKFKIYNSFIRIIIKIIYLFTIK